VVDRFYFSKTMWNLRGVFIYIIQHVWN